MEALEKGKFRVYGLVNPLDNSIFYVGSTIQKYTSKRIANHIEEARNNEDSLKCQIIRELEYKFDLIILFESQGDNDTRLDSEQHFIDLVKPISNVSGARTIPPNMGGWNKTIFPDEFFSMLGTMPDYKLAEIYRTNKYTVARIRREKNIKSYAELTGNDGKRKKGTAKGTVKGFYTKVKPEFIKLMGTMPDKELAHLAGLSHSCIFVRRKELKIKSFGNNHGRN